MDNKKIIRSIKIIAAISAVLYLWNCIENPDSFHFIVAANLIIHEAGHFIFIFFGEFIHILGGSLTQVLIPIIFAGYFFVRREMYSGGIVLLWAGESIVEVARYAADAIVMQLPLLGGDNVIHDWNYIFSSLHVLQYTAALSSIMNALGYLVIFAGIVFVIVSFFNKKSLHGDA